MGIFDFLFNQGFHTTTFLELYKKIVELRAENIYPYSSNLPKAIQFPNDFWRDLIRIYKETNNDGLERAFSIFYADGDIVFTEVKTGSDRMVKSGGSIQVKYSHHPTRENYARKELYIDNRIVKKRDIYYKDVPKALEVQYLFNIHTHPKHITEDYTQYYNFFSAQDIKSLLSSKAIMTGLVTDRLWIIIRTNLTPSSLDSLTDLQVTPEYLENTLHIGVYVAEFNRKVYRYTLVK